MPNKNHSLRNEVLMGSAVAAMAAAIAGTYFLYGSKNAAKNRKKVKAWTLKAKGEILEKMEKLSEVSEKAYHNVIDQVAKKYQGLKSIDKQDVVEFAQELKKHWKSISREIVAFHKKKGAMKK